MWSWWGRSRRVNPACLSSLVSWARLLSGREAVPGSNLRAVKRVSGPQPGWSLRKCRRRSVTRAGKGTAWTTGWTAHVGSQPDPSLMLRSSSPLAYRPHRAAYSLCDLGVIQPRPLHVRRSLGVSQKWSFVRVRAYDLLPGFQIIFLKKIIAHEFRLSGIRLYETRACHLPGTTYRDSTLHITTWRGRSSGRLVQPCVLLPGIKKSRV